MRVTPKDIASKTFPTTAQGLDPAAVKTFLDQLKASMEALIKDGKRMHREIESSRGQGDEISQTLIMARRMTEGLKKTAKTEAAMLKAEAKTAGDGIRKEARGEADMLLGEAHLEAQSIVAAACDEKEAIDRDIARLRSLRVQLLADLRGVMERHSQILSELERSVPVGDKGKG